MIVLEVLKLCVQWPKTGNFKELHSKPMFKVTNAKRNREGNDLKELLESINENIELAISGVNFEIVLIADVLFKSPREFHLRQLDNIVISKMGFEVLIIEFEKLEESRDSSRSLLIEITAYRSIWFNISLGLSTAIFFGSMIVASLVG